MTQEEALLRAWNETAEKFWRNTQSVVPEGKIPEVCKFLNEKCEEYLKQSP